MDERTGRDSQMGPPANKSLEELLPSRSVVKRISYTHDAMIDLIIADPLISQGQLARHFGYTEGWVSQVFNSDNFRERLAERKGEVVDPVLKMSIEEKLRGLVDKSIEVLMKKLVEAPNGALAIKALDSGSRALGYGARTAQGNVTQNNYIALVPPTSASASSWAEQYKPGAIFDSVAKEVSDGLQEG
jgi:hypothetical protein